MDSLAKILWDTLHLPNDKSEMMDRAVRRVADLTPGRYIAVRDVMDETGMDLHVVQSVLAIMLLTGVLRGRFAPYHIQCDSDIGPPEDSEDIVRHKIDTGAYPFICPSCSRMTIQTGIHILFFLPATD